MTLEDKVHATRLLALQRAKALGNVSAACRELGISRSLFYRWRERYLQYGRDGLHPRHRRARRGRPHGLSLQEEQAILAMGLSYPTRGPAFYAPQLGVIGQHFIGVGHGFLHQPVDGPILLAEPDEALGDHLL